VTLYGHWRSTTAGEILFDVGQTNVSVFAVLDGAVEIITPSGKDEAMVAVHEPGSFIGEVNLLSAAVPGAQAAIFRFTRRLFTVHNRALAQLLTQVKARSEKWAPGIQQDVSQTGALFVPTVSAVGAEYDLLAFDTGPQGERDLYLGDRLKRLASAVQLHPWPHVFNFLQAFLPVTWLQLVTIQFTKRNVKTSLGASWRILPAQWHSTRSVARNAGCTQGSIITGPNL